MKKIICSIVFLLLIFPGTLSAHMIGQPPYFKINGVFTDYYPVPSTSLSDFNLPQDLAKENFLAGQELDFEIDLAALPVPPEIVKGTRFVWDFGDGTKAEGLKNKHSYTKPGTYFLVIKADSGEGVGAQLLQSTAINILPAKDYKLPKAVISIDNKESKDPLLDILEVDFKESLTFDASKSESGDSPITEYFWDLGDQNSKTGKTFEYKYNQNPYILFPVLRIKTADGFISDSYVQLSDRKSASESGNNNPVSSFLDWKVIAGSAFLALLLTGIIFLIFRRQFSAKPR